MNKQRGSGPIRSGGDKKSESAVCQISRYYLELEQLLGHIECSSTHYQVLRLKRSATGEEIKLAYKQAVTWLHPSYNRASFVLVGDMRQRIDRALQKVSLAFSVLTNFGKRVEYDNSLSHRTSRPLPLTIPGLPEPPSDVLPKMEVTIPVASDEAITAKHNAVPQPLYSESVGGLKNYDRRKCERFKASIPVRVTGYDRTGARWRDVAQTVDLSQMGLGLRMTRRVRQGMVLRLTLALPTELRSSGYADQSYSVYALVRRVGSPFGGARTVGLEFLGEHPPDWSGPDRRREPREPNSDTVVIDFLDESMEPIAHEVGTAENLSAGGMRAYVKVAIPESDFVRVTNLKSGHERLAAVRNQYVGQDGFERLCLQFVRDH